MPTIRCAAFLNRSSRSVWVATIVPFPGKAMPRASVRQFIEFAVPIIAQDPQVGQALSSTASISSSVASGASAT